MNNKTRMVSNAMERLIKGREAAKRALDSMNEVTKAKAKPVAGVMVAKRETALPIPTDDTRPNA